MLKLARLGTTATIALACALLELPMVSSVQAAEDQQKPTVIYDASKNRKAQQPVELSEFAKAMQAAQEALQKEQWDTAIAELKKAQNAAGKKPEDDYAINEALAYAYAKQGNYAEAGPVFEATLDSAQMPPEKKAERIKLLASLYYEIKNYDKAMAFGNRAIEGGFASDDLKILTAQSAYLKKDYKSAAPMLSGIVNAQLAANQTPRKELLSLTLSACSELDDKPCATRTLEQLAAFYPSREYWHNLVYSLAAPSSSALDKNRMQIYRLALEIGLMEPAGEYLDMAGLAIEKGLPGEAQQVLEKGNANGVFTQAAEKARYRKLLEMAKTQAASDRATLAKGVAEATAAKNGNRDVGLGSAYYTYGQYSQAIEALERGLAKSGIRNEADTRLLLGMAQLKAGKTEEARKTFALVKGDPTLERLGKLWLIYLQHPFQAKSAGKV